VVERVDAFGEWLVSPLADRCAEARALWHFLVTVEPQATGDDRRARGAAEVRTSRCQSGFSPYRDFLGSLGLLVAVAACLSAPLFLAVAKGAESFFTDPAVRRLAAGIAASALYLPLLAVGLAGLERPWRRAGHASAAAAVRTAVRPALVALVVRRVAAPLALLGLLAVALAEPVGDVAAHPSEIALRGAVFAAAIAWLLRAIAGATARGLAPRPVAPPAPAHLAPFAVGLCGALALRAGLEIAGARLGWPAVGTALGFLADPVAALALLRSVNGFTDRDEEPS